MTQPTHSSHYLPGLDGLRAIACLMVFGVHFGQITRVQGAAGPFDLARLLDNGNTGVALFFALSGFLLSLPYWKALESGARFPSTGAYFLRRAARILPAYFACLTLLIVVNRFWQKADWLRDALLHYTLTFNFLDATIFRINPPFWTVAVEAQFYLLLPLLFLLAGRLRPGKAVVLVLGLGAAAYLAHYLRMSSVADTLALQAGAIHPTEPSPVLTYSLLAHLPHFLMGVATGWLFIIRNFQARTASRRFRVSFEATLWIAALMVFAILSTPIGDALEIPYGRYNFPYVPFLLCLIVLLTPVTASGRVLLDSWPLRWIGILSYGVYIYHFPILHATARYMGHASLSPRENWLVFGAVSLGLTLAVAATSYWVLEKPVLKAIRTKPDRLRTLPGRRRHTA